jgi:hypothetical protein
MPEVNTFLELIFSAPNGNNAENTRVESRDYRTRQFVFFFWNLLFFGVTRSILVLKYEEKISLMRKLRIITNS